MNLIKTIDELKFFISQHKNKDFLDCECEKCKKHFLLKVKQGKKINDKILCRGCRISDVKMNKSLEEKSIINEKREKTNIKKFGVSTPLILNSTREKLKLVDQKEKLKKIHKTLKERYGDENYNNREKANKTMIEKYGSHSSQNIQVKEKQKQTNMIKYGFPCSLQSKKVIEKAKQTSLEKYGTENPMQSKEIINKMMTTRDEVSLKKIGYSYNNIHFDSSWELAYYIWLTDNKKSFIYHPQFTMEYFDENNVKRIYFPDFLVEGKFIEIKGNQFFNEKGEPYSLYKKSFWWEKYNLLKKNNVYIMREKEARTYLKYVHEKYGTNYIKSFKNKNGDK